MLPHKMLLSCFDLVRHLYNSFHHRNLPIWRKKKGATGRQAPSSQGPWNPNATNVGCAVLLQQMHIGISTVTYTTPVPFHAPVHEQNLPQISITPLDSPRLTAQNRTLDFRLDITWKALKYTTDVPSSSDHSASCTWTGVTPSPYTLPHATSPSTAA